MSGLRCAVPADWWNGFSNCLYDWQTLITGIAAVIVGGATVAYLRKQINQSDRVTNEDRRARLNVARAKLIVPSSLLAHHARYCLDQLLMIEQAVLQRNQNAQPISIPPLPTQVEIALDAILANTRDRNAAFAVSAIYGEQQVLTARAADLHINPRSHAAAYDYYCMQPVIMDAIAIKLLIYARRETASVEPITWDDMIDSIRRLVSGGQSQDRLVIFIEERKRRNRPIPFAIKDASD